MPWAAGICPPTHSSPVGPWPGVTMRISSWVEVMVQCFGCRGGESPLSIFLDEPWLSLRIRSPRCLSSRMPQFHHARFWSSQVICLKTDISLPPAPSLIKLQESFAWGGVCGWGVSLAGKLLSPELC